MALASPLHRAALLVGCLLLPAAVSSQAAPATAQSGSAAAARGVRCPPDFDPLFDSATHVLRCRRDVVSWVVTICLEKQFGSYVAKPGADTCFPTEIPGVGSPPGSRGTRSVACATSGYTVVADRTGPRDRCERVERLWAFPVPAR